MTRKSLEISERDGSELKLRTVEDEGGGFSRHGCYNATHSGAVAQSQALGIHPVHPPGSRSALPDADSLFFFCTVRIIWLISRTPPHQPAPSRKAALALQEDTRRPPEASTYSQCYSEFFVFPSFFTAFKFMLRAQSSTRRWIDRSLPPEVLIRE